ncbi:hypothetical protein BsIDN1_10830 [Bacillus safensis]|uniref:Uncharacterized protein n=1 Tax=Bacillus safensis TaxID=561879 RepID=A0A5S9M3V6_BACIA|nr:hypothetical protein BsIDN1_10830 [Bacillus safensis]
MYVWNQKTGDPVKEWDDVLDSVRYALYTHNKPMRRKKERGEQMNEFVQYLREHDINSKVIDAIIKSHKEQRDKMINQYERYKASIEGVPILQRDAFYTEQHKEDFETGAILRIDDRVNNRLNNGFDSEIVDTKSGLHVWTSNHL